MSVVACGELMEEIQSIGKQFMNSQSIHPGEHKMTSYVNGLASPCAAGLKLYSHLKPNVMAVRH